ncbi:ABC transporter ATP-binding protein [Candidatus Wolfebacteria bacterium]|nr:ABC transporter ATP-binding protein [Candidatus Wolfebacteria bacterium]
MLLQLKNISVHYGGVKALDGADISIDEGEIVALMGPNGAGKSTALRAFFGLAPIASGEILYHRQKIKPVPHRMVRAGVSFVPQGRRTFPHLTIEENLEVGGIIAADKKEIKRRISEIFEIFPVLKHKKSEKAANLSGGEQQMLALGRGLMADPKVLLLDEPTLGLAPKIVKEVFEKIKEINERHKTAIMIVEHNIKSVLDFASRAYVLNQGKVIAEGPSLKIKNSDILEKAFLGKAG